MIQNLPNDNYNFNIHRINQTTRINLNLFDEATPVQPEQK